MLGKNRNLSNPTALYLLLRRFKLGIITDNAKFIYIGCHLWQNMFRINPRFGEQIED
jgi:hypothetical protein